MSVQLTKPLCWLKKAQLKSNAARYSTVWLGSVHENRFMELYGYSWFGVIHYGVIHSQMIR